MLLPPTNNTKKLVIIVQKQRYNQPLANSWIHSQNVYKWVSDWVTLHPNNSLIKNACFSAVCQDNAWQTVLSMFKMAPTWVIHVHFSVTIDRQTSWSFSPTKWKASNVCDTTGDFHDDVTWLQLPECFGNFLSYSDFYTLMRIVRC